MENITEMLKGVLEGCVLQIISKEEVYGYQITKTLNDMGFTDVVDGTVYTILVRLEKNKYIKSEKCKSEVGPPRKMYTLTSEGAIRLEAFWNKWEFVSEKINILKEQR